MLRRSFYLSGLIFGVAVVGAVLTQWLLDWQPCVMCVEIRAWLILASVLFVVAGVLPRFTMASLGISILGFVSAAMAAFKGGQLFSLERGWVESFSCSPFAQFPKWLPLDRWIPYVFQPQAICGESIKSIIIPLSAWPLVMLLISGLLVALAFKKKR